MPRTVDGERPNRGDVPVKRRRNLDIYPGHALLPGEQVPDVLSPPGWRGGAVGQRRRCAESAHGAGRNPAAAFTMTCQSRPGRPLTAGWLTPEVVPATAWTGSRRTGQSLDMWTAKLRENLGL
jgi:hypothetical protein